MASRPLRIAMLVFTTLWFGVLVPVHQRGEIQLPGAHAARAAAAAEPAEGNCCPTRPDEAPSKDDAPPCSSSTGSCAVCYFIATLDLPPDVVIDVPRLGFVEVVRAVPIDVPVHSAPLRTCSERGPPLA